MNSSIIKIIAKILLTALVIGGVFYFFITPKLNELVSNQISIQKISSDLSNADAQLAGLKTIEKNKSDLESKKALVDGYLPNDPEASNFIVNMEKTSSQIPIIIDGLSVTEIKATNKPKSTASEASEKESAAPVTPAAKAEKEKALAFSASFKAPYDLIMLFFSKMEQMPRFNTIENITIGGFEPNTGTLSVKTEGKIYYGK